MVASLKEDKILDTRQTLCPVPIIRARHALDELGPGQVLKIMATDPGSWTDFPAFARNTGNELLDARRDGNEYVYYLRKAA